MSREIPYDENLICDICHKKGAFDFMGDYLCEECALKNYQYNEKYDCCNCDYECECDCNEEN